MDIAPTFEEWKANKRVTWEESKTQSSISEVFFLMPPPLRLPPARRSSVLSAAAFMCAVLMTGGWQTERAKSSVPPPGDISFFFHTCGFTAHVTRGASRAEEGAAGEGNVRLWQLRSHWSVGVH